MDPKSESFRMIENLIINFNHNDSLNFRRKILLKIKNMIQISAEFQLGRWR